VLIHPPSQASATFVARTLRLERAGLASQRRILADRPAQFDCGKTERELRTCWTLGRIGGPIIREIILAEEPELLVGRGHQPGYVGRAAGFQAGLDLLAVVVAPIRHGSERATQDVFGLQRHRPEAGTVPRVVGHVVGDNARVLPIHRRLHVVANLGAVSLPALHGTALRLRQGERRRAARCSLCLPGGIAPLAVLERLQLRLDIGRDGTAGCPRLVLVVLAVQCLELALDAWVDLLEEFRQLVLGEVALFGVDRFALAAVNGHECSREEIQRLP